MTTTRTARHQLWKRTLVTVALAGSTACTIENPCPVATRPEKDERRCVDADAPKPADDGHGAVADTRAGDARISDDAATRANDAAPPAAPDAGVMPAVITPPAQDAGPIAPPATASTPWPDHLMTICWAPESVARSDFTALSPQIQRLAEESWPRAANVQLQGFAPCAGTTTGTLVLRLADGFALEVTEGYLGRAAEHRLTVGVARKDLLEGLIPHALAHVLGLAEGPHPHDGCAGAPAKNARDALGECRPRAVLSFTDRAAARVLYGTLPANELDPRRTSFDGDRAADLVLLEPSGTGARVAVALSSGHDFAAAFSGTWAQLATMPSALYGGDYNGDGLTDLGVYDRAHGTFTVLLSAGTSFDAPHAELWHAEVPPNSKVVTGDYDADGKTDLVFVTPSRKLRLALSTETGFTPLRDGISGQEFGGVDGRHIAGDFDGDGDIDLAYLEPSEVPDAGIPTQNSVWLALSDRTAFRPVGIFLESGWFGGLKGQHFAAHLEADKRDELAYYEPGDGSIIPSLYEGPSTVSWPAHRQGTPAALTGLAMPQLADFDGDGSTDVAYLDIASNEVRLLLARGTGLERAIGSTMLQAGTISLLTSSRDSPGR